MACKTTWTYYWRKEKKTSLQVRAALGNNNARLEDELLCLWFQHLSEASAMHWEPFILGKVDHSESWQRSQLSMRNKAVFRGNQWHFVNLYKHLTEPLITYLPFFTAGVHSIFPVFRAFLLLLEFLPPFSDWSIHTNYLYTTIICILLYFYYLLCEEAYLWFLFPQKYMSYVICSPSHSSLLMKKGSGRIIHDKYHVVVFFFFFGKKLFLICIF